MLNIVLYQPEIAGNTGNIMRTCVAVGARLHLIKPLGFSLEEKYVKRSAVNYIEKLEYYVYNSYEDFLKQNPGEYYFYTRYGHKSPDEFKYPKDKNIYLVFGKESTGIDKEILKEHLDKCIRIPTTDKVRALNLANSVAIGVYEVIRQNNYKGLLHNEPHKGENYLEEL